MLSRATLISILLALLLVLATPVAASDVTAFTGFTKGGSALRTSPMFGGSFSVDFAKRLSLEQRLSLLPQFPQVRGTNPGTWGLGYNTSVAVNLPGSSRIVPYALGGVGFVSALRNDPLRVGTKFDLVYGGGLKVFDGSKRFGLKFEARGHRIPNLIWHSGFNTVEFTVGPVFRIGGE